MGQAAELLGVRQAFLRSLDAAKLLTPQRSAGDASCAWFADPMYSVPISKLRPQEALSTYADTTVFAPTLHSNTSRTSNS
ncbi:hypothetical protein [Rhodococcus sp. ARC_M6]|uniref:hypothetical protein n=1 Tax=Rhodococcus sp. ARC_M6 TaxID=2928852 RepID=UPI0027E0E109|nr:hypothetical protein [Rhodococcus sp. ARC_M6]